jgi:hypothetical protein
MTTEVTKASLIRGDGFQAFYDGKSQNDNPFDSAEYPMEHTLWQLGWKSGKEASNEELNQESI